MLQGTSGQHTTRKCPLVGLPVDLFEDSSPSSKLLQSPYVEGRPYLFHLISEEDAVSAMINRLCQKGINTYWPNDVIQLEDGSSHHLEIHLPLSQNRNLLPIHTRHQSRGLRNTSHFTGVLVSKGSSHASQLFPVVHFNDHLDHAYNCHGLWNEKHALWSGKQGYPRLT
jgi:hypothetical protein